MNTQDEAFLTTKQEPLKLHIALSRYFGTEPLSPEWQLRYHQFLTLRIRAVLPLVIKENQMSQLRNLVQDGFLCGAIYRDAILLSAELNRTEMTAFLLKHQQEFSHKNTDSLSLDF